MGIPSSRGQVSHHDQNEAILGVGSPSYSLFSSSHFQHSLSPSFFPAIAVDQFSSLDHPFHSFFFFKKRRKCNPDECPPTLSIHWVFFSPTAVFERLHVFMAENSLQYKKFELDNDFPVLFSCLDHMYHQGLNHPHLSLLIIMVGGCWITEAKELLESSFSSTSPSWKILVLNFEAYPGYNNTSPDKLTRCVVQL